LHSTGNLFHVGLVLAGLFLLGRELLSDLGPRRFAGIFAASILTGAMVWGAINWRAEGTLIGATAGVYGLLTVHALLHPNREHSLLLFFFFPVTFRPKHLAVALLVFDVLAVVLIDWLDRALPFSYAPSAHLGGMMAGWAYCRFFHAWDWRVTLANRPAAQLRPTAAKALAQAVEEGEQVEAQGRTREDLRQQTDRILDKINSQGFGALTPLERKTLDDAKELLNKR
jgi:membrane associated rhomboid family serine protease